MDRTGLVHIYTGDGKGKTTAAIGLGIRACGSGLKVLLVQFLKSSDTGELCTIKKLGSAFSVTRGFSCKKFVWNMTPDELTEAAKEANDIFQSIKNEVLKDKYDLIILDELLGVMSIGFLEEADIIELIKSKPKHVELVITGRDAQKGLIQIADYVSEIKAIKHPFDKGISARKGIEF
ncbi:MAG TPA: cob(I)yrinic acid a,c-diamide adenosyltransferase [Ruminiclostridium sp.]